MSELKTTSLSHKDNNTGTPNITMYPDGTTSLPGTMLGGFRNQIINGDFRVWQRGTSFSSAVNTYTADRWRVVGGTSSTVRRRTNNDLPFDYDIGFETVTAGFTLRQGIELLDLGRSGPFASGTTWTLSFWTDEASSYIATSLTQAAQFRDGVGGGNATVSVSGGWPTLSVVETNGSWSRLSTTATIDTACASTNSTLEVRISVPTGNSRITGIQLEPGPVATPFEIRPISVELSMCQRYFETGRSKTWVGGAAGGGIAMSTQYKVSKRVVATLFYGTTTGFQFLPSSTESNYVEGFVAQNAGSGEIAFTWSADAEL